MEFIIYSLTKYPIFDLIAAGQIEYIIEKSEEYLDKYMEELKEYV